MAASIRASPPRSCSLMVVALGGLLQRLALATPSPILRPMTASGSPEVHGCRRAGRATRDCLARVRDELRARGLRWTPQRRLILEVLSQTDGHVTGSELVERCRERTRRRPPRRSTGRSTSSRSSASSATPSATGGRNSTCFPEPSTGISSAGSAGRHGSCRRMRRPDHRAARAPPRVPGGPRPPDDLGPLRGLRGGAQREPLASPRLDCRAVATARGARPARPSTLPDHIGAAGRPRARGRQ